MRIVVAGGTGTVGRHVVDAARERGHDVVVLTRARGADVSTGSGVRAALEGADAVVDVTNTTTLSAAKARAFFTTATRTLLTAEKDAGVQHHVAISIVGIGGLDASYYAGKLAQERAVAEGDVPYTIARVAQFHEFATQVMAQVPGPIALLPTALMRPVAAREAGVHLVAVAEAGPAQRATDLVGPRNEVLADVARRQLAFDGIRRPVWQVRFPGPYGKGLASGALRGDESARQGEMTFDDWLRSPDHRAPSSPGAS